MQAYFDRQRALYHIPKHTKLRQNSKHRFQVQCMPLHLITLVQQNKAIRKKYLVTNEVRINWIIQNL